MFGSIGKRAYLRALLGGLVLWIFFFSLASSQFYNVLYLKQGTSADIKTLGRSVAGAGDVDGDGKADFIIGAPGSTPGGIINAGSAFVYSGLNGSLHCRKDGLFRDFQFGWSVGSAGDIEADGKADFIVGEPRPNSRFRPSIEGFATLFSGAACSVLCEVPGISNGDRFGYAVSGLGGDASGDGHPDYIVGAPRYNGGAGTWFIEHGPADGCFDDFWTGGSPGDNLGFSVSGTGDINGNGKPDFIVGAPLADTVGRVNAGAVYVRSDYNYSVIFQRYGGAAADQFGYSVSGGGDINGDGKPDFIVGAPYADTIGRTNAGAVYVYSGLNGSTTVRIYGGAASDLFGFSVAIPGDVNGDGRADFIVGAKDADSGTHPNAGCSYVYSGLDFSLLSQKCGTGDYDQLGYSVSGAGDVNADGKADIIVGIPYDDGAFVDNGSALVLVNCPKRKGDMNGDGSLTPSDVVLLQNCVNQGSGDCNRCFADMDCDGDLDQADIDILTGAVFLGTPLPC